MYRIGIDLGGTNIAVGVLDEENCIAASAGTPTRAGLGAEQLLDDIAQCVMNALNFAGILLEECAGIGIGTPGSCDTQRGVVHNAHNLGWENVPVCDMLRQRLGLPAVLANDADCAALGEVVAGAARGRSSALLITLGTGVGGGYVADGIVRSGYRGLGGEFGHICIAMDGELCSCGRRGCWEAYASATALIRQAKAAALACPASVLNTASPLDGRAVYAAAAVGDETARAVTARYAEYVGVGLVSLINALYPEVVLIGGGISGAGEALLDPLRRYVAANAFVRDPDLLPVIRPAALGSDAGVIGAAALIPPAE